MTKFCMKVKNETRFDPWKNKIHSIALPRIRAHYLPNVGRSEKHLTNTHTLAHSRIFFLHLDLWPQQKLKVTTTKDCMQNSNFPNLFPAKVKVLSIENSIPLLTTLTYLDCWKIAPLSRLLNIVCGPKINHSATYWQTKKCWFLGWTYSGCLEVGRLQEFLDSAMNWVFMGFQSSVGDSWCRWNCQVSRRVGGVAGQLQVSRQRAPRWLRPAIQLLLLFGSEHTQRLACFSFISSYYTTDPQTKS